MKILCFYCVLRYLYMYRYTDTDKPLVSFPSSNLLFKNS